MEEIAVAGATNKHATFNAGHPVITIRCESQTQKDEIDRLAVQANLPRNTFILNHIFGRNTGSNTTGQGAPGGSNTTKMKEDLHFLVFELFNYIGDHGADNIPDDLINRLAEIQGRLEQP